MGRKPDEPDLDLPPLTFKQAAWLFDVDEGEFMMWAMKTVRVSPGRWGEYESGKRTLPEKLIRRRLTEKRREAEASQARIQRSMQLSARKDEKERGRVIGTQFLQARARREKSKVDRGAGAG